MARNSRNRNTRHKPFKNPVQFMRGLVIETLGVATLIFLYFIMQISGAAESSANQRDGGDSLDSTINSASKNDSIWTSSQSYSSRQRLENLPVWCSLDSRR